MYISRLCFYIICTFVSISAGFSQNYCDLQVSVFEPVNQSVFDNQDTVTIRFFIKNNGPSNITVLDTLVFKMNEFPINTVITENISVGDSVIYSYIALWNDGDEEFNFESCMYARSDLNASIIDTIALNDTSCFSFTIKGRNTSLKTAEELSSIAIFPNPASSWLHLSATELPPNKEIFVEVRDGLGNSHLRAKYTPNALPNIRDIALDISGLNRGIYFVELRSGQQRLVSRFIKE